jgi:hypothetical protein
VQAVTRRFGLISESAADDHLCHRADLAQCPLYLPDMTNISADFPSITKDSHAAAGEAANFDGGTTSRMEWVDWQGAGRGPEQRTQICRSIVWLNQISLSQLSEFIDAATRVMVWCS